MDKNVYENLPKVSTRIHSFCPLRFAFYGHGLRFRKNARFANDQTIIIKLIKTNNLACPTTLAVA